MSPPRRSTTVIGVVAAAALIAVAVLTLGKLYETGRADSATDSAVDLGQQVQQACAAGTLTGPLCAKANQVVDNPAPAPLSVAGTPGVNGIDGKNGLTPPCYYTVAQCVGPSGANGANGKDGLTPPCMLDGTECRGPAGKEGQPGATVQGPPGTNGTDGQSPACLSEPDQCRGSTGATGQTGPAPGGWTYTDALGIERACTPDAVQPDPGKPHYTCA